MIEAMHALAQRNPKIINLSQRNKKWENWFLKNLEFISGSAFHSWKPEHYPKPEVQRKKSHLISQLMPIRLVNLLLSNQHKRRWLQDLLSRRERGHIFSGQTALSLKFSMVRMQTWASFQTKKGRLRRYFEFPKLFPWKPVKDEIFAQSQ